MFSPLCVKYLPVLRLRLPNRGPFVTSLHFRHTITSVLVAALRSKVVREGLVMVRIVLTLSGW